MSVAPPAGTQSADTLSVLTHGHNLVTKTWQPDGTIRAFDDAKYYSLSPKTVGGIEDLSALLTLLEADPHSCLIRGTPVAAGVMAARDGGGYRPGSVRKANDYFDDQALHTVLIDVDGYRSIAWDEQANPLEATAEFIATQLPSAWHGRPYHWQLSSSFGHPTKAAGGLRVHLWFWLTTALTSAQLKAHAVATGLQADTALFHPVQAHFTANPVMGRGVVDTVAVRSGFVPGSGTVDLDLTEGALAAVGATGGGGQVLLDLASTDAVAVRLNELGMVVGQIRDGFNIVCPFEDEHSGPSAPSSTRYSLPFTGGYREGHFKCLHAHCVDRPRSAFLEKLGLFATAGDDFDDVSGEPDVVAGAVASVAAVGAREERFQVFDAVDFIKRTGGSWFIKGVLPNANFGVFFGASGSGKSFFVFDMMASLARGIDWRGHKTVKARVLWIAAEGQEDMRKRVQGYCQHHGLDPAAFEMKFIANAPNLLKVEDVRSLVKQVRAAGAFDVIVVDTLAQTMPGGNENSGEDMGLVMGHCKEITRQCGAMVAPVHHSGKDESRGARGWSGLKAACDFEFEVTRADEDRVATVTKMKGGADGEEFGFCLETIVVGQDTDGDDETTCIVATTDGTVASVAAARGPGGAGLKEVMQRVHALLQLGDGPLTRQALVEAVAAVRPRGDSVRDARAQNVRRDVNKLVSGGFLAESASGVITLPQASA